MAELGLAGLLDSFKGGPINSLCLHIADRDQGDDMAIFCMLLWSIWFYQNRWVFEGKCDCPGEVLSRASRLLGDFLTCDGIDDSVRPEPAILKHKWHASRVGCIKINVDVAVDEAVGFVGIGVVARDE